MRKGTSYYSDAHAFLYRPYEGCLFACENVCVRTYREVIPHNVKVDKPDHQPGHQREHRNDHYEGHKVSTEPVCKLLDGGLSREYGQKVLMCCRKTRSTFMEIYFFNWNTCCKRVRFCMCTYIFVQTTKQREIGNAKSSFTIYVDY